MAQNTPLGDSISILPDLTQQGAFARLRDAADLADEAGFVSRAEVAELADARGSGPRTRKGVGVRVPSSAPKVPQILIQVGLQEVKRTS